MFEQFEVDFCNGDLSCQLQTCGGDCIVCLGGSRPLFKSKSLKLFDSTCHWLVCLRHIPVRFRPTPNQSWYLALFSGFSKTFTNSLWTCLLRCTAAFMVPVQDNFGVHWTSKYLVYWEEFLYLWRYSNKNMQSRPYFFDRHIRWFTVADVGAQIYTTCKWLIWNSGPSDILSKIYRVLYLHVCIQYIRQSHE